MQPAYDSDDQDFQPAKKPRTLCKLHHRAVGATPKHQITVDVIGMRSTGKENRPPADVAKQLCPGRKDLRENCETLPLRRASHIPSSTLKQPPVSQPLPACHRQTPTADRTSVRAFFTRSQGTHSWHGKQLESKAELDILGTQLTENRPAWASQTSCPSSQNSAAGLATGSVNRDCISSDQELISAGQLAEQKTQSCILPRQAPDVACTAQIAAALSSEACAARLPSEHHNVHSASASTAVMSTEQHSCTAPVPVHQSMLFTEASPLPGNFIVLDASDSDSDDASDDGNFAQLQTQALQSEQDVLAWLQQHGLSAYATAFSQAEVDMHLVPCLTDSDLKQMGVTALGPRRKILAAAAKLSAQSLDEQVSDQDSRPAACAQSATAKTDVQETALVRPARKDAFAILMQQAKQVQGKHPNSFGGPEKPAAPTDALSFLMQQARAGQPAPAPGPSTTSGRGHKAGPRANRAGPLRLPEWQLVPGTHFVVDKFGTKAAEAAPQTKHSFLTHFHADHYGGLGPRFKQGTIYCSPITARLVHQRLKVPPGRLQIVPLHSPIQVAGVTVTFVDAHHCPGAVMILFEASGKLPLLHTGDCRCHTGMQEEECLQRVRGGVDLILDTTYCQPQYIFPKQEEVLSFVLDAVRAEAFNETRTLFLFGSYTIGKEKLFLEVARTLKQKMYVSMAKRKVLECIELPGETLALLTSNDKETNLHAVPLWSVTLKSMARLLKHYRGRYTTVVGFQPTGWTQKQDRGRTGQGRRKQKGTLITYQVPYSEHSSFPEMKEFVSWLRPRRIIPSVGNDNSGPKAAHMVSLLRSQAS